MTSREMGGWRGRLHIVMVVLHRNDCIAALAALRKGSFASRPLQDIAVRFAQRCARLRTKNFFLHVCGESMVAERER